VPPHLRRRPRQRSLPRLARSRGLADGAFPPRTPECLRDRPRCRLPSSWRLSGLAVPGATCLRQRVAVSVPAGSLRADRERHASQGREKLAIIATYIHRAARQDLHEGAGRGLAEDTDPQFVLGTRARRQDGEFPVSTRRLMNPAGQVDNSAADAVRGSADTIGGLWLPARS
jgi:hypothetical protein